MSEKIDKGFCLVYNKLSYRRKFIRTLWLLPVYIAILFMGKHIPNRVKLLVSIPVVIIFVIQARYTYVKWKKGNP